MPEFTDYMRRVRTLLIVVSLISIALVEGGLSIDPSSSVLGVKFKDLSDELIKKALLITNIYLIIHFLWGGYDSWRELCARFTGSRVAFVTTGRFSSSHCDYPSDPRQSTLYNWWKDEASKISSLIEPLETTKSKLEEWEQRVNTSILSNDPNLRSVVESFRSVQTDIEKVQKKIETVEKTLTDKRIPASLERFDNRFKLMLRSQNLRWLVLELTFPLIIGFFAVCFLISGFCSSAN